MPRKWKTVSGKTMLDSRGLIYVTPYKMFVGTLTLPTPVITGTYGGRDDDTIIFENWDAGAFGSSDLADDAICSGVAYETESSIYGEELATFKSITVRTPDSDNVHHYPIQVDIRRSMGGDNYTFVNTPVLLRLTLTWKLMKCADVAQCLLGLLCYDNIRIVWGDNTYKVRLVSDVYGVINTVRAWKTTTLDFEGIKVID